MQNVSAFWSLVATTAVNAIINGIFFTLAVRWITKLLDGDHLKEKK